MPILATTTRPAERNTEPLSTAVTPTTKACVRKAADQAGISMAEWVRRAINTHLAT